MAVERFIRKTIAKVGIGLSLQPKPYPTPLEARVDTIIKFLYGGGFSILYLKPLELLDEKKPEDEEPPK